MRRDGITLGFDADGNITGLEDVPFEIPYPSDDHEVNLAFQKKVKALLTPPKDEPLQSPADVYRRMSPHGPNVLPFPVKYQKIGAVVGFENPGMYPFNANYFGPPKPMTIKIKFHPITIHREIGHCLLNGLDFKVELVETAGNEISGPARYLVLEPIPAVPETVVPVPAAPDLGVTEFLDDAFRQLGKREAVPELPFGRKAVEAVDKAMEVVPTLVCPKHATKYAPKEEGVTIGECPWCLQEERDATTKALRALQGDKDGLGEPLVNVFMELASAKKEIERLKDWKESALAVEALWDEQAVAKELKVGLGQSVRDKVLPAIRALRTRAEAAERERDEAQDAWEHAKGGCEKCKVYFPDLRARAEKAEQERDAMKAADRPFQIRFDGPPGPEPGRFIEVEDLEGHGISKGRWEEDGDTGYWLLIFDGRK